MQKVNNIGHENIPEEQYNLVAEDKVRNLEEEQLNFLGDSPCFRGSEEE